MLDFCQQQSSQSYSISFVTMSPFSHLLILLFASTALSMNIFEQMFQGGGQQQQQTPQDMPSDSQYYRNQWEGARCSNYLCPGTLSCVHFPHHCPCAFPDIEDKVELGEGIAICASKGGFKPGEASRKIELARKGLL